MSRGRIDTDLASIGLTGGITGRSIRTWWHAGPTASAKAWCGGSGPQTWFWSLNISDTLASSKTARMASATILAIESTTILSIRFSSGTGTVLVTTTSANGA